MSNINVNIDTANMDVHIYIHNKKHQSITLVHCVKSKGDSARIIFSKQTTHGGSTKTLALILPLKLVVISARKAFQGKPTLAYEYKSLLGLSQVKTKEHFLYRVGHLDPQSANFNLRSKTLSYESKTNIASTKNKENQNKYST